MALAYLLDPVQQFQNRAGVNNVNGYFEVFFSGTDDHATVYRDFDKTLAPAKIRIDNNGRCVMVVDSSKAYRVEMREPNGDLVFSQYPVWAVARGGSHGYTAGFGITISELDDIAVDTDVIQKKLNAGDNIQIDGETDTISATDTTYTAGANVSISDENVISATDTKYSAGSNISISDQNVISAVDTKYTAGANVSISDQNVISAENTTYSAGANVQINNNVISATDTKYTAGAGLELNGTEFSVDTDTVQSKLTAGSNISINGSTISATDTTYSAGPNIDIYNNIISTEKPRVTGGTNVSVNSVLDPQTRVITYTVSATDTTYNVFDTATDGLVPKANGTGDTGKYLKGDGTWSTPPDTTYNVFDTATDGLVPKANGTDDTGKFLKGDGTWEAISTTVNATAPLYGSGTPADPLLLRVSHGLSLAQPAGGYTYLQVTHPVPAPGSTSAGKVLTCDDALENLSWQTPAAATGVQEIVKLSNTYAEVTAIISAGNEPVLAPVVDNGAGFYRRVFTGPITTPPNPVTAVKFARLAGSVFEMYTIDSSTGNWVYSSVPLTKHRNNAELYYYDTDHGDNYHVRGIQNYAVNHVAVQGHSSDICSIVIEAPTLGLNEEYDYVVVFDCSNSSGGCNVSVQGCDCEIDTKWEVDVNAVPLKTFAIDVTNTYVEFSGSPQYQIEVLGNRWHRHKF